MWIQDPGWEALLQEGMGKQLQYACLENPCEQRSLEGCTPQGRKELDTTEAT